MKKWEDESPSVAPDFSLQVVPPAVSVSPQSCHDAPPPKQQSKDNLRCILTSFGPVLNLKRLNSTAPQTDLNLTAHTLLSAATLWASWASISGNVSALWRVCCSFCLASSRRSWSCLFFSSLWVTEQWGQTIQNTITNTFSSRKIVLCFWWRPDENTMELIFVRNKPKSGKQKFSHYIIYN